jgi:hypothetical protein
VDKFWEDPWSTKTKPVLVKPKVVTKTCFITETNPFPTFDLIIQLKMGSMFRPAASSSLTLSISQRAPPAMPAVAAAAAAVATAVTTTTVTTAAATMVAAEATVACGGGDSFEF